jgi:hypothetical protein
LNFNCSSQDLSLCQHLGKIGVVWLLLFSCACNNWGWKNLESDHEPVMNIFALIALDSTATSFVQVRQSLNLDETEYVRISHDTLWYGDSPYDYIFENAYLSSFTVDSAVVMISDGTHAVRFFPVSTQEGYMSYYQNIEYLQKKTVIYLDTLHQLDPEPGTEYFLDVVAPDGRHCTGSLVTPELPEILSDSIPDTLHLHQSFSVLWKILPNDYQVLETSISYWGIEDQVIIEPGQSEWSSIPEDPSIFDSDDVRRQLEIKLTAMDENYYQYFYKKALDDEFVSFLLGSANSGVSCGIEGGYGVFGAIASDRVYRVAVK